MKHNYILVAARIQDTNPIHAQAICRAEKDLPSEINPIEENRMRLDVEITFPRAQDHHLHGENQIDLHTTILKDAVPVVATLTGPTDTVIIVHFNPKVP